MLTCSGQRAQGITKIVRVAAWNQSIDFRMRLLPRRKSPSKQRASGRGNRQTTGPLIFLVDRNLHQSATFKRLEGRGQCSAVHGKHGCDAADARRFWTVQRHQQ